MGNYQNELLCQSKTEIKKVWENLWDRLSTMDPVKDYKEYLEINKQFDKCVEAYYAVDCGDYWKVQTASTIKGKSWTYNVMKETK